MPKAVLPANEEERLALIEELEILYSAKEEEYENLAYLASVICETPIALISIVDKEKQWFKSHIGIESEEMERELAFCSHAILDNKILYVPDSSKDPRFADNPIVNNPPYVKFYAGFPLDLGNQTNIGSLCVIDHKPNTLNEKQIKCLEMLANQVTALLKLRLVVKQLQAVREKDHGIMNMLNHELRNPLTSILGYLSILESGDIDELPERVASCGKNAKRMLNIVDEFLFFSELEEKAIPLDKQSCNINKCIKDSIQLMGGMIAKHHLRVDLSLDETIPKINIDKKRIIQVIDNFISNACKYADEGKRILISSTCEEGWVKVSIRDFGPGIPEENKKRLFEPFSKGVKPVASSSGLGLSIAKLIVNLHDGEVGVQSKEHGTTFFFALPL